MGACGCKEGAGACRDGAGADGRKETALTLLLPNAAGAPNRDGCCRLETAFGSVPRMPNGDAAAPGPGTGRGLLKTRPLSLDGDVGLDAERDVEKITSPSPTIVGDGALRLGRKLTPIETGEPGLEEVDQSCCCWAETFALPLILRRRPKTFLFLCNNSHGVSSECVFTFAYRRNEDAQLRS